MNDLQIFKYNSTDVRTIMLDGEPWFVAKDVCDVLGIDNTQTRRLDDDEKGLRSIQTPGGNQEMLIVNEAGLYNLVLGSKKPEAKPFKRWVTHEVLPTIRKHGAYATPEKLEEMLLNPDSLIKVLTALKDEREKVKTLQSENEQHRPKVLFADAVAASKTSILIGELAKIMKQNGVEIGQNRLFAWLRNNGYLIKRQGVDYNMPTQRSMELGLFEIKETIIAHSDGHTSVNKTPKVTGKGQVHFINMFVKSA